CAANLRFTQPIAHANDHQRGPVPSHGLYLPKMRMIVNSARKEWGGLGVARAAQKIAQLTGLT
ncbi:MAG TPA: hypothetical protein VK479_02205, partial [Micropepsaceae bacterium]|nr:hypothetical protein [Micropepsaceae bacterium]